LDDFSLVSISVVKESLTTAIDGKKYSRKGAKAQREGLFDFIPFRRLWFKKISLFLCVLPAVGRLCAFAPLREKKSLIKPGSRPAYRRNTLRLCVIYSLQFLNHNR